jgi:hypothetical protein
MRTQFYFLLVLFFTHVLTTDAQLGGGIKTKEGFFLASRNLMMAHCLEAYKTDQSNATAKQICQCRIDLLDERYSSKQILKYQKTYKDSALTMLIKDDKDFDKDLDNCIGKRSYTSFLKLPASAQRFRDSCKASFKRSLEEKYNEEKVDQFCSCAINVLKEKPLTEKEFEDLYDVNSLLYNEVNYYCSNPVEVSNTSKWQPSSKNDVSGPKTIDTIKMIAIDGMQKLKIRIGDFIRVAMLDCGATDILLPSELMNDFLNDPVLSKELKFIDIGKYELANGTTIECKRYLFNGLQLGSFTLSNVVLASTEKHVTILVGRTILNKFKKWNVDNEKNILVLEK